jgi:hypothetical protein
MAAGGDIRAGRAYVELYAKDNTRAGVDAAGRNVQSGMEQFGKHADMAITMGAAKEAVRMGTAAMRAMIAALRGDWEAFEQRIEALPFHIGHALIESYRLGREAAALFDNLFHGRALGFDPNKATADTNAAQGRVESLQAVMANMDRAAALRKTTPAGKAGIEAQANYETRLAEIQKIAGDATDGWTADWVKRARAAAEAERAGSARKPVTDLVAEATRALAIAGRDKSEQTAYDLKTAGFSDSDVKTGRLAAEKIELSDFLTHLIEEQKTPKQKQDDKMDMLHLAQLREIKDPAFIQGLMDKLLMSGPARGIMGSAAIQSLQGGGGDPARETAKATRETARHCQIIASKVGPLLVS